MNIKPGQGFEYEALKNPPLECEVSYSWVWNGPITREGIDERLDNFAKAGIKSLYILPLPKDFGSESLRTFMSPEYLSEEFWELVDYALHKCVAMGIEPWIYDEGGWPSGGACYNTVRENPKAKLKYLERREVTLMSDKRFVPEEGFVALFNGKHRLPDNYIASRDCTLTAYYQVERVERGCRVDYTNASVTDTFIKNTYEKYKAVVGDLLGKKIPLFFTDEPGLMRASIADNEWEQFIAEFGYDLRDYLYVIEDNGSLAETEKEKQARIDHNLLLGKLFRENTFRKLHDWCESKGVYYSGHLDIDNRPWGGMVKGYFSLVDALRNFHVPGIDVIWEQIRYPYGGRAPVDDETLGMGFFPRLAPSAARQEGRNLALTETFSIYGDVVTPDEMRYISNYQAVRGINVFNFLTLPYERSRCGSVMMRPGFCPEKPGFFELKHINEYYARLSYLLRLGHAEGDTALYLPCRDHAASPNDLDDSNQPFKDAGTSLEERNIPFDIIDDFGIRDAEVTDDGLKLGDAVYRHIVVSKNKFMPEDVKKKIAPYLGEGAPTYVFNNKNLRVMTRKLDTGRLWFIFNEGIEPASETADISDGKKLYRIDLQSGNMYLADEAAFSLVAGDMAVYLVTDEEYPTATEEVEWSREITGFESSEYDRFVFDFFGVHSEHHIGEAPVGEDFSGTVYYTAPYTLKRKPKAGERYRVRLEDSSVSATVLIDGEAVATVGMTPMVAELPAEMLGKSGTITVMLSNTPANELVAKRETNESFPKAEVGSYIPKMTKFESRRPELKLGRVFIEKMI